MSLSNRTRTAASLTVILLTVAGSAAAAEPRLSVADDTARSELLLTAGPLSGNDDVVIHSPRALLAHRFVLRVMTGQGGAGHAGAPSTVIVYREDATGARTVMAMLSPELPESALPRPLSYEIRAGDRIGLLTGLAEGDAAHLVVTIEYEAAGEGVSRLPVVPLTGVVTGRADSVMEWAFEAPTSGRLLALAGLPEGRGQVILLDEAGEIVFRCAGAAVEAFAGSAAVVRVGVALHAGRHYRVIVEGDATGLVGLLLAPGAQRLAAR
jgi:hypothetical protein